MSLKDIDKSNIPRHVAVIMDGNGRWAKKRGLRRENGHREGKLIIFLAYPALEIRRQKSS